MLDVASMPVYRTKPIEVQALKISRVVHIEAGRGGGVLHFQDARGSLMVDADFMRAAQPAPGCYLIRHFDGFQTCAKPHVFEAMYTRVVPPTEQATA